MFLQLWHVGRITQPALQPDGMLPVAPSAIKPAGEAFIENEVGAGAGGPVVTPPALEKAEVPHIVRHYEAGAMNDIEAGFDGVGIDGADCCPHDQVSSSQT